MRERLPIWCYWQAFSAVGCIAFAFSLAFVDVKDGKAFLLNEPRDLPNYISLPLGILTGWFLLRPSDLLQQLLDKNK